MIIPVVAWIHTSSVIYSQVTLQHVYSRWRPDSEKAPHTSAHEQEIP